MIRPLGIFRVLLALFIIGATFCLADYPKPSPYPITWELKFEHGPLRRVMVKVPGSETLQPFWYLTYTVTNNTDREQVFLPVFEMMTKDGNILRSDKNIPSVVFDVIKLREKKRFLEPYPQTAGELRLGEDQARDGVAIFPEPMAEMGDFSIFVGSLSGEIQVLKNDKGEPMKDSEGRQVILRKTLQLHYLIRGDEVRPGEDPVTEGASEWVMR